MNNQNEMSCEGCRYYLGGGMCRIHLEDECAEGGGYEAYRAINEETQ